MNRCKELGIVLCGACLRGSPTCAVDNHKQWFEEAGVRNRVIQWVKLVRSNDAYFRNDMYFRAALKHYYPEHYDTYEKLLLLI